MLDDIQAAIPLGVFLNAINVGVLVFWLGLIIVIGPNLDGDPKLFLLFFSTPLTACFITDLLKITPSKRLQKQLTPPIILNVKKAEGAVIVVCGIVLIVKGFLPKEQLNLSEIIKESRKIKKPQLCCGFRGV